METMPMSAKVPSLLPYRTYSKEQNMTTKDASARPARYLPIRSSRTLRSLKALDTREKEEARERRR